MNEESLLVARRKGKKEEFNKSMGLPCKDSRYDICTYRMLRTAYLFSSFLLLLISQDAACHSVRSVESFSLGNQTSQRGKMLRYFIKYPSTNELPKQDHSTVKLTVLRTYNKSAFCFSLLGMNRQPRIPRVLRKTT